MNDFDLVFQHLESKNDILRELNNSELLELENLYKNQSKDIKYHYLSIYNQRIWNEKLNDYKKNKQNNENDKKNINKFNFNFKPFYKKFYTHRNGDLLKNGTYFSFSIDCKTTISFHTLESTSKELTECLKETKIIFWKEGPLLAGIHFSIMPLVKEIVIQKGAEIERNRECIFLLCENGKGRNLPVDKIDEKYKIQPLSQDNIKFIHGLWPNNKEGSIDFLSGLISLNKSLGIYFENNLLAWIFQNEFAGIGILHVLTEERRKGFAKVLTNILTKDIALSDENIDVAAFTVYDNLKSQSLLEKVGYKNIINTFWMQLVKSE